MAIVDGLCRLAAIHPAIALFLSGVLLAALVGLAWAWCEAKWERASW